MASLWAAAQTMSLGVSQFSASRAIVTKDLSLANRAVLLAPSNPESFRIRAAVLRDQRQFDEAIADLKEALKLSPRDWELWAELGDTEKLRSNLNEAIKDYSEAVRYAPGASSHWRLGNSLLEAGHVDEGFTELRRAIAVRPSLFSQALELAWQEYADQPQAIERALQPITVNDKIELGMFLGKHGNPAAAATLLRNAGLLSENDRLSLLKELLEAKRYEEAYAVWSSKVENNDAAPNTGIGSIANSNFEDEIDLNDPGFGWRFRKGLATVSCSRDTDEPHSGSYSLRFDWRGDADRSAPVVQQLVLVDPGARYRLSFAARTQSLSTICSPVVTVIDPNQLEKSPIAQSSAVEDTSAWRVYTLEFTTGDTAKAVTIGITRQAGPSGPCPIFGSTWFDDFSLVKI